MARRRGSGSAMRRGPLPQRCLQRRGGLFLGALSSVEARIPRALLPSGNDCAYQSGRYAFPVGVVTRLLHLALPLPDLRTPNEPEREQSRADDPRTTDDRPVDEDGRGVHQSTVCRVGSNHVDRSRPIPSLRVRVVDAPALPIEGVMNDAVQLVPVDGLGVEPPLPPVGTEQDRHEHDQPQCEPTESESGERSSPVEQPAQCPHLLIMHLA
jgi:hypothetical protein